MLALFELADDEFVDIRDVGLQELKKQSIHALSLKQYLRASTKIKELGRKSTEQGFAEMNQLEDNKYLNEFLKACQTIQLKDIGALDDFLSTEKMDSLIQSVKRNGNPSLRVGALALCLMILYHSKTEFSKELLSLNNWTDPVLTILVDRL